MVGSLRVDDPELRYAAVRLRSDLSLPDPNFVRENDGWVLRLPPTRLARLEYQLELSDHGGTTRIVWTRATPRGPRARSGRSQSRWLTATVRPPG